MNYNLNNTLESVRQLNLTGNIIPHTWYSKITFKNGAPDLLGIVILADIVYWYRPIEIKDEKTGRLIGYKKKFRADMLQRSLSAFSQQFGYNKRQIADALKRLEDAELIIKRLKTIDTAMGVMNNVLFVAPIPSAIAALDHNTDQQDYSAEITESDDDFASNEEATVLISSNVPPTTIERSRGYDRTYEGVHSNVVGDAIERSTYTENTTKITTNNSTKITAAGEGDFQNALSDCEQLKSAAAVFSKKLNLEESDAVIGETLTRMQVAVIQNTAAELCNFAGIDLAQLSQEIQYVILSSASFSYAGRDFAKKLNTIKKTIKERGWNTPVGMIEIKETQEKNEIDQIRQEANEAELDCAHWQKMVAWALEKGNKSEAENFNAIRSEAKKKLAKIRSPFTNIYDINQKKQVDGN